MLNLHQPAVTPCGQGRPGLSNSHPMRAGTPGDGDGGGDGALQSPHAGGDARIRLVLSIP